MPGLNNWRGDAQAIAQVDTYTLGGTFALGQVYTITINLKDVSYTTASPDAANADAVTGLLAALQASDIPEFAEVTWSALGLVITGTSATAGMPFAATSSATGTGTLSNSTVVASSGPNHWDSPDNWSAGAVPVNNDLVDIQGAVNIKYGLAQSGVTVASLDAWARFTGTIGNPRQNPNGYYEYRDTYLQLGATVARIGAGAGNGSPMIKWRMGTAATTVTVYKTASPEEDGSPAVWLVGTNASNSLFVLSGFVGVNFDPAYTSQFPTIKIGYQESQGSDVTIWLGSGLTAVTTLNAGGGTIYSEVSIATLTANGATIYIERAAAITTLTGFNGRCVYRSTGTISTAFLGNEFVLDFTQDNKSRTLTNCTMYAGSSLLDTQKTVTLSNAILLSKCGFEDVTIDRGSDFSVMWS